MSQTAGLLICQESKQITGFQSLYWSPCGTRYPSYENMVVSNKYYFTEPIPNSYAFFGLVKNGFLFVGLLNML